jgi:hypothetical protein
MEEQTYREWWPLHLRVARGESLSEPERQAYEAGLHELQGEESAAPTVEALRGARSTVRALEAEHAELQTQQRALDIQIRRIERALSQPTRELLGVGS